MTSKYFIAGGIVLCLLSCSNERAQTTSVVNDQISVSEVPSTVKTELASPSPVKVVGYFTNVQSNGVHQWGYTARIWKWGDRIYGLFSGSSASRLVGDPPTGVLDAALFDEKTGKFSFDVQLPNHHFRFNGILTKDGITGRLMDVGFDKIERITLKKSNELTDDLMNEYPNLVEWRKYADRILLLRGVKP